MQKQISITATGSKAEIAVQLMDLITELRSATDTAQLGCKKQKGIYRLAKLYKRYI